MSEKSLKVNTEDKAIEEHVGVTVQYGPLQSYSFSDVSNEIHPHYRPVFSVDREFLIRKTIWDKIRSGEFVLDKDMKVSYNQDYILKKQFEKDTTEYTSRIEYEYQKENNLGLWEGLEDAEDDKSWESWNENQ